MAFCQQSLNAKTVTCLEEGPLSFTKDIFKDDVSDSGRSRLLLFLLQEIFFPHGVYFMEGKNGERERGIIWSLYYFSLANYVLVMH